MILISFLYFFAYSRVTHNPITEPAFPVIQNQGFTTELNRSYYRFPERAKNVVRDSLWHFSLNSAGLAIYFKTNSPNIYAQYYTTEPFSMPSMSQTGVTGVDLLGKNETGHWSSPLTRFAFNSDNMQVAYAFLGIRKSITQQDFEYRLYLPLFNTVSGLEIITDDGSTFTWIEKDYRPPIVFYGTSIIQGCCSSRPINSITSIVQRHFDMPVLNFGFSGNGKLEESVIKFIVENDAVLYVLDCLPNIAGYSQITIKNLVMNAVRQVRKARPNVPILIVDFAGYSDMEVDHDNFEKMEKANKAQEEAFQSLINEGQKKLFYLTRDEIGLPLDSWTDSIHPNNYGSNVFANAYIKKIEEILAQ